MNEQLKIGLALGSGGARGLAHIGVLKALEEYDIKISYICGSSIGALVGAAYAIGMPVKEMEERALQIDWKQMAKLFFPTLSLSALINDNFLWKFLKSIFNDKEFEDSNIPFSAIATDIETGEMLIVDSGKISHAVRASVSIPMIFSPVKYNKYILVDGGLTNPIPVDIVKKQNMDRIIAVNIMNKCSIKTPLTRKEYSIEDEDNFEMLSMNEKLENFIKHPVNYINDKPPKKDFVNPRFGAMLNQMLVIPQVQMSSLILKTAKPDILIEPESKEFKMLDFLKSKELIEIGYKTTISKLSKSRIKLK